jgi:MFS transporter, UMF1 family
LFCALVVPGIILLARPTFQTDRAGEIPWTMKKWRGDVFFYLVGAILIVDAIYTLEVNVPLYFSIVSRIASAMQPYLMITILTGAACGGLGVAVMRRSEYWRFLNMVIVAGLALATCTTLLAILTLDSAQLFPLLFVAGVSVGALEALLREGFARYAPAMQANEYFSYYGIANRFATLMGPALMAITMGYTADPVAGYRGGFLLLAALLAAGIVIVALASRRASGRRLTSSADDGKH